MASLRGTRVRTLALAMAVSVTAAQSSLDAFLPPQMGVFAANADLITPLNVDTIEECAQLCLNYTAARCIHINICTQSAPYRCGIGGYNRTYTMQPAAVCSYYQRIMPRNDTRYTQVVPWVLTVPTRNVTLNGGILAAATATNAQYLLQFSVDDILYNFRKRAGVPQPPGAQCVGWMCKPDWVESSFAGLALMGAGNMLRWQPNATIQAYVDNIIDGIANCSQSNGFIMAFNESMMAYDEHPDYALSWLIHGLLDAHIAGNPKALPLARGMMNWFNNHTLIPTFLPPDGGNAPYQTPYNTPPGYVANQSTGFGAKTGHLIYLIDQGIIHNTQMALSDAGTQADVDLVVQLYQEQWWLEFLASGDPNSIWQKQWYPHNYEVTAFEAYADMYVLTGNQLYLDAVMQAWRMFRTYWLHVGGSVAINEGDYYEPGSYYLTADAPSGLPHRDAFRARRLAFLEHRESHHHHDASHEERHLQNDWGKHPTGEMCGAVFWLKLNQRFHRLWPTNETFVAEIEKEMFNEALTHQAPNGVGIRYFSNLNGQKELPAAQVTCCEGQGTRLLGSMHEYLFSYTSDSIFIDVYSPSSFTPQFNGVAVNITVDTMWPYGESVVVYASAASSVSLNLQLRIPSWVAAPSVPVTVSGKPSPLTGVPGSYLSVPLTLSSSPITLSYSLTMAITSHPYTGKTQIPGYTRAAFTYGPILLAAQGDWNSTASTITLHGLDPMNPSAWMVPAGDGVNMHFNVTGTGVTFVPNYEIQTDYAYFSAYPAFD